MIAYWKDLATVLGKNTVSGSITRIYQKDTITRPFYFSYFVSAPGIAFHLDKGNVCYLGVPNPITISIPGYPADKIKLRVEGAKVSKTGDSTFEVYFAKMPAGKAYAYVDATNAQGRTSTVHSMELKLKNLPAPVTNFDLYKENGIDLENFLSKKNLSVFSVDSAFQMEYKVNSFQVESISHDGKYTEPVSLAGAEVGNNNELVNLFKKATSGDRFIFSHIKVSGTNHINYEPQSFSLKIK